MIGYKVFENVQRAKSLLKSKDIDPKESEDFKKIRDIVGNNTGYVYRFTKWYFEDNEPMDKLEEIYKMLNDMDVNKSIDEFDKLEDLYDYLQSFGIGKGLNQVLKSLPSKSRELVDERLKNLITLNIEYSDQIKDFYSKKGGKFKNPDDLYEDTKIMIENLKGEFNLETVLETIEGYNVDVMFESPTILIIRVNDYEASKALGSRSWCISTSKNMWDQYNDGFTAQYFVYNFTKDISDKEHLVGLTIKPDGTMSAGHYYDDSDIKKIEDVDLGD